MKRTEITSEAAINSLCRNLNNSCSQYIHTHMLYVCTHQCSPTLPCRAFPVYDTKCAMALACWYCSGRCDNCMKKTSFDAAPMIGYHDTSTSRRFCNSSCLKYYESGLAVPIQLNFVTFVKENCLHLFIQ